jgi:hypothetical protein
VGRSGLLYVPEQFAAAMLIVIGARRAFTRRELGSGWASRQSLVDLASICELPAGELPRPCA